MNVRSRLSLSPARPLSPARRELVLGSLVLASLAVVGLSATAGGALAQRGGGGRGRPPGPPPEALAACEGHTSGDACSVETPEGTRRGTCWAPEGLPLACAPEGGPGPGHRPPPEAIESCRDTAVGDACVVETPRGTLEGTCEELPVGVACVPAGLRH